MFQRGVELLRHRIYAAKAERVNPQHLELEFKDARDKLDKMAAELEKMDQDGDEASPPVTTNTTV